ncbi:MAG: DNA polymerase III subunit [Bacteroidota bacterium]
MELVTHSNWNSVIGQERVKKILQTAIRNGRVAHAYLFWGNDGVGTEAIALEFARTLLCKKQSTGACGECSNCKKMEVLQHPNLKLIFPLPGGDTDKPDDDSMDGDVVDEIRRQTLEKARNPYFHIEIPKAKFIRIKSIREIKRESSLSSAETGKKIFVIFDADAMNDASANSLLKILEEPLDDVHFLLTTSRKDAMKQTIISRCQLLQCSMLTDDEITRALIEREGKDEEQGKFIARLAGGNYTKALELFSDDLARYRGDAVTFLRSVLGSFPAKVFDDYEEYLTGNRRNEAEKLLLMLHVWMRDAIMIREGSRAVFNVDQLNDLQRFVDKFSKADIELCLAAVERALELLRRNVYLPLVMLSVIVRLRRILHAQ